MAQSHHCPCCHATIWRREVKTCGSPQCLAEWRSMSLSQRAKMIELAEDNPHLATEILIPTPTTPSGDELLKQLFGDKKGGEK